MSKKESKIPLNLWNEFDEVRASFNKTIAVETVMMELGKICKVCIWGTNVDGKKIFCPFHRCIIEIKSFSD